MSDTNTKALVLHYSLLAIDMTIYGIINQTSEDNS